MINFILIIGNRYHNTLVDFMSITDQDRYLTANITLFKVLYKRYKSEKNNILKKINFEDIPKNLEYLCPITLEDTTNGGVIILQHITRDNSICYPKVVISKLGYDELVKNDVKCIYCRSVLNKYDHFAII